VYLASAKRLSISRPVHLSSMDLNEEEEGDDLFSRLRVLLTSIAYLKSTPFRSCEPWLSSASPTSHGFSQKMKVTVNSWSNVF
jgi:hypothetical protein